MLNQLWNKALIPSNITLGKIMSPPKTDTNSNSYQNFYDKLRKMEGIFIEDNLTGKQLSEEEVLKKIINSQKRKKGNALTSFETHFGTNGQAIIHPPVKLGLPDMLLIGFHFDKGSTNGPEDALQVFIWDKTPGGYSYVSVAFIGDNQKAIDYQKKLLKGIVLNDNFQLVAKDEIKISVHGNQFFCGWTKNIPLTRNLVLPPGSFLLEGYGDVQTRALEMQYPSGYSMWNAYNGLEAFVTYFHSSEKYSGPATDGFLLRDSLMELYPP